VRWADEVIAACKNAGLDPKPIHRFTEHLEGYRRQDPIQRAASLRAALAILGELESDGAATPVRSTTPAKVTPVQTDKTDRKDSAPAPTAADGKTASTAIRPAQATQNKQVHLDESMSAGHAALTLLSADVTAVPGVGPSVAGKLRSLGIRTVRDLLFYFPRQYRDYSKLVKIAHIPFDEVTTTLGLIWEVETIRTSGGRARTIATISDETGKLRVTWFNQPYLQKQLHAAKGSYLVVTGVKRRFGNKVEFNVRSHELPEQGDLVNTGRLVPIYPLTEGLNAKKLRTELAGTVLEIVLQHDHSSDTPETLKLLNNHAFTRDQSKSTTIFRNMKEGLIYTFVEGILRTTRYTFADDQLAKARR